MMFQPFNVPSPKIAERPVWSVWVVMTRAAMTRRLTMSFLNLKDL